MTIPPFLSFLRQHPPQVKDEVVWHWHGHDLVMRLTDHLSEVAPPVEWVTSVRCVVLWRGRVLTVQGYYHDHILPGGRREPGESLVETAQREVLEETGWRIGQLSLLGFRHFCHQTPKPPGYPFMHPNFLQVVFTGRAVEFCPSAKEIDGYELGSTFYTLAQIAKLNLTPGELFFLQASLQKQRPTRVAGR